MIFSLAKQKQKDSLLFLFVSDPNIRNFFIFALLDVSIVGSFLASFFKNRGFSLLEIGFILSCKNIARLVSDIPFGMFADFIGTKRILLLSRILRVLSVGLMLFASNLYMAGTSMVVYGLSMGSIYGKIDGYLDAYSNVLSSNGKNIEFGKILSLYYLLVNIVVVIVGLMSTKLFSTLSYSGLIVTTMATSIMSFFFWFKMANVKDSSSVSCGVLQLREAIRKMSPKVFKSIFVIGIFNLLAWGSNTVFSVSLISYGVEPKNIAILTTLHFLFIGVGYFLSTFFVHKIKPKNARSIVVVLTLLFGCTMPLFNVVTLLIFYLFTITIPLLKTVYESLFYDSVDKKMRNVAFSFSTFFTSIFTIYLNIMYPFLAKSFPLGVALLITMLPFIMFSFILPKS